MNKEEEICKKKNVSVGKWLFTERTEVRLWREAVVVLLAF